MLDVAIIGAGPYGLSLAAHLKNADICARLYGAPMESWRRAMPAGMFLRSAPANSSLHDPDRRWTLAAWRRAGNEAPFTETDVLSIHDFLDYAAWFRKNAVEDIHEQQVSHLQQVPEGYRLTFSDGEIATARRVVIATGPRPFRVVPDILRRLPDALTSHSSDHTGFARFEGQDVTIIGGGQSALETAALLHEAGARARILMREEAIIWDDIPPDHRSIADRILRPAAGLGPGWRSLFLSQCPDLVRRLPLGQRKHMLANGGGSSGAWWLRHRVENRVSLLGGRAIESVQERGGRVELWARTRNGSHKVTTDHIIAATGYWPDVRRLDFIDRNLVGALTLDSGSPVLDRNFETQPGRLHFIGMTAAMTFGPVMCFMHGARYAAPALSRHLLATRVRASVAAPRKDRGKTGAAAPAAG